MFGGDDALIKRCVGIIYVLVFLLVALALFFNLVQIGPGKDHRFDPRVCTYQYRSIVGWGWLRINAPVVPYECHYAR